VPSARPLAQTVVDRIEVSVVELDVSVRDRRGQPVSGLARESFSVTVAGEVLEITNFLAVEGRHLAASGDSREGGTSETHASKPEPRHLALFFDESGLDAGERHELSRSIRGSLTEELAPGARVMVAGRDASRLRIYQPLTDQSELLSSAVELAVRRAPRSSAKAEMQELVREIERAISAVEDQPRASGQARARTLAARSTAYASEAVQRVARSAEVVEQLVRLLAGMGGRTAVLYVGDGLTANPGELLGSALREAFNRFELSSESGFVDATSTAGIGAAALARVGERAAASGVVFYALDTVTSEPLPLGTAEYSSIDTGRSGGAPPPDTWIPAIASRRRSELQSAVKVVTEATGGAAFSKPRDAVAAVLSDLATYYSIGVRAPETGAALERSLRVTVEGKNLTVRHRRVYRPRSADERDADRTLAALLKGPGENALGASVSVGEIEIAESGLLLVPVAIRVPVAGLAVLPNERSHDGQLTLFVASTDEDFHVSEVRKAVLPVRMANEELAAVAGGQAEYRVDLRLPVGPARIAVGVRDDYDPDLVLLTLDLDVEPGAEPSS